ncbi:MAG: hypothetical protein C7B44_04035 [Sulfobacillus thermosulfidooxidans]|uniref:hypothetical protein n=1 Tax=Sulfobacillus TaxID=28033 RepID=UPI000CD15AD7|nr:hypothetical protein [Sulfobacillus sp. hq2]POB10538.1 hypothetical protein CO251_09515 [Sulfobacillus sp. hq2]PSR37388.1 MAG: hypothetical protein C7B44_04035 [Sulfobacillus thermosulfidooxidans]
MHVVIWAYLTYLLTFVLGVIFFLRYDLRRRKLPPRFLAVHLFLTVMTFILFSSAMAPSLRQHYPHPVIGRGAHSTLWLTLHRHGLTFTNSGSVAPSQGATK